MSFCNQIRAAVDAAPVHQLAYVSGLLWKAYAAGQINEDEASALAETIERRKALPRPVEPRQRPRTGSRPRTSASLARRRTWASCGLMPATLASSFTPGQNAALAVVAAECRKRGRCDLYINQIAAVAGCCPNVVRQALRQAVALGLLTITERRRTAWRNDSNLIVIASQEWATWLRLRPRGALPVGQGGGCISVQPTPSSSRKTPSQPDHSVHPRGSPGLSRPPDGAAGTP